MATVTGLTAERMLEIEAESIVDGDVVGNNLILRRHDGATIDAGPVRGPKGDQGSAAISVAQSGLPVLDVGIAGQIRAGRQLTVADFTRMGLSTPAGLFNLSDLSNLGAAASPLVNKGSIPFGVGINGLAATAAVFSGSTAQALYISDVGAADPFRIRAGSVGCWFRTAKRSLQQFLMSKDGAPGNRGWQLYVGSGNTVNAVFSADGTNWGNLCVGITDVADDRWHHAVFTHDGGQTRVYVDGMLEMTVLWNGLMFASSGPLNIGSQNTDATVTGSTPCYGRIDEAFVTSDVLSESQVRLLYCAKIAHGYSAVPFNAMINVHRRRKGAPFVAADFPSTPRRLYAFQNGSLVDAGVDNQALANNGAVPFVAGADGSLGGAPQFDGSTQWLSAGAAGLPTGLTDRSVGAWFKTTDDSGGIVTLSGTGTGNDVRYLYFGSNTLRFYDGTTVLDTFRTVNDGLWHFAVVTIQNTPADGVKVKLYLDGQLVAGSTSFAATNAGLGLDIGRQAAGTVASDRFNGTIDNVFFTDYALTPEQIRSLYAKGAQDLGASPKNPGDHIEAFDATNVYAIFDQLESQNLIDMAVAA